MAVQTTYCFPGIQGVVCAKLSWGFLPGYMNCWAWLCRANLWSTHKSTRAVGAGMVSGTPGITVAFYPTVTQHLAVENSLQERATRKRAPCANTSQVSVSRHCPIGHSESCNKHSQRMKTQTGQIRHSWNDPTVVGWVKGSGMSGQRWFPSSETPREAPSTNSWSTPHMKWGTVGTTDKHPK